MPGSQATRAVHLSDGEDADGGLGQSVRSTNNATGNRARARRGPVSNADHDAGNDRAEDELDSDDDDDLPSIAAYGQPSVGSKGRHARDSGNASTSAGPSTSRRTSRVTGGVGGAGDARDDGSGSAAGNLARASISPKKKRQKISADELEEIRRRQALEQQQDDFFTNKRSLVFVEKGKQITKRVPTRAKTGTTSGVGQGASTSTGASTTQAKQSRPVQTLTIELDSEESSSSTSASEDKGSDAEDEDGRSPSGSPSKGRADDVKRKRRKKAESPTKLNAPVKPEMIESSSSSMSLDSGTTILGSEDEQRPRRSRNESGKGSPSARSTRKGKGKEEGHGKAKDKGKSKAVEDGLEPRERSLSPIAPVDTFVLAHALQDVRRNAPIRRPRVQQPDSDGGDLDFLGPLASEMPGAAEGVITADGQHRGRSTSASVQDVRASLESHNLGARQTPLVPDLSEELTEEELDAKYGPIVSIQVSMVHDPRIQITDQNRRGVGRYTAPMDIKIRLRENFDKVFGLVSSQKGIERSNVVITYNDQRLYTLGTPQSLGILSTAAFKAYDLQLYEWLEEQKQAQHLQSMEQIKSARLQALAKESQPGGRKEAAIILLADDSNDGSAPASPSLEAQDGTNVAGASHGGDDQDSDIETVSRIPSRLGSSAPQQHDDGPITSGPPSVIDLDKLVPSTSSTSSNPSSLPSAPVLQRENAIKLGIRGGKDAEIRVLVPKNKTIAWLIRVYLRKRELDVSLVDRCRMTFDGEELDRASLIQDIDDIGDGDLLDIQVPV